MTKLNPILLTLILFGPFIFQSKAWELNQLCQQTCWGFDCVKQKPTQMELCDKLKKNSLKCCSQYANRNTTTTTTSKPCQEDVKSQFKEKKRKKKQEGWYLNDACQTACYIFSCLFGMKPTEEELCQVVNNRYNDCCFEKYSTTTSITTEKELVLVDPDLSSSASQEPSDTGSDIEILSSTTVAATATTTAPPPPTTTIAATSTTTIISVSIEEIEEVDVGDEATTDVDLLDAPKKSKKRKPRPANAKSKKQKYMKIPDK